MYRVLRNHATCRIPEEALYVIRFHSFYPYHTSGDYRYLCDNIDTDRLEWLKRFKSVLYNIVLNNHVKCGHRHAPTLLDILYLSLHMNKCPIFRPFYRSIKHIILHCYSFDLDINLLSLTKLYDVPFRNRSKNTPNCG